MRFLLSLPLLVALAAAAPYTADNEKTIITTDDYADHLVIYESKYDIVDIMVPVNAATDIDSSEKDNPEDVKKHLLVFFIEAEYKDGCRTDRGVYVYNDGKVTKVMDTGKAISASDLNSYVYIGGKDGLHVYDPKSAKAYKYGNFEYSVKDMAQEMNTGTMYILTEDRVLYRVYDSATMKEEMEDIKNAEQIMMDYSNNLYFYGDDKKPYIRNVDGEIMEFDGLPQGTEVRFLRPPLLNNEGVEFLVDSEMYTLYPNGKFESSNITFMPDAKPTAYSIETVFFPYFGYNKKIYEFELLSTIDSSENNLKSNEITY